MSMKGMTANSPLFHGKEHELIHIKNHPPRTDLAWAVTQSRRKNELIKITVTENFALLQQESICAEHATWPTILLVLTK